MDDMIFQTAAGSLGTIDAPLTSFWGGHRGFSCCSCVNPVAPGANISTFDLPGLRWALWSTLAPGVLGNPFWAAFGTTLGFAWIVSPVPDHHHQAESLESAKRLDSQAPACMSSEHRSELLLAELLELWGELAQLSNRVLSLESQIQGSSFLSNPPNHCQLFCCWG